LVEAFDGEGGDELVGAEVGEGGCAVGGWGEVGGVEGLEAAEDVELVVCCCDVWGVLGCDCNEDMDKAWQSYGLKTCIL
jgi:hypothetical protein